MKYLVVVLVAVGVLWFMLRRSEKPRMARRPAAASQPRPMVRCAHCGVYLPAEEALAAGSLHFCGHEHLALGQRAK